MAAGWPSASRKGLSKSRASLLASGSNDSRRSGRRGSSRSLPTAVTWPLAGRGARIWDTRNHNWAGPELSHPQEVVSLSFNSQGNRLVTGCADRQARVFSVVRGNSLLVSSVPHVFRSHSESHGGLELATPQFISNDRELLTLEIEPTTKLYNLRWSDTSSGKDTRAHPARPGGDGAHRLAGQPGSQARGGQLA